MAGFGAFVEVVGAEVAVLRSGLVLSRSTIEVDRGGNARFYMRLPSLAHMPVHQDQMRAAHHHRADTGRALQVPTQPADRILFAALGCGVRLEDADRSV